MYSKAVSLFALTEELENPCAEHIVNCIRLVTGIIYYLGFLMMPVIAMSEDSTHTKS